MAGETFNTKSVMWSDPKQLADKAAEDETVSWSDWAKEAAAATVDIGAGAATRMRRSDSDSPAPAAMISAPNQIQGASGLWCRRSTPAPSRSSPSTAR